MLEDRDGAGARRHLGVGAQDGKRGVAAIELCQRLALSGFGAIFSRSRDELVFSTVARRAANFASGPLASPTANTSVSELRSQSRPPATVTALSSSVSRVKTTICARLLLATGARGCGGVGAGEGASALMADHPSGTARCRNGAALPGESVNHYKRKKISYAGDDILPRAERKPAAGRNLDPGSPAPRCDMTIATVDGCTQM